MNPEVGAGPSCVSQHGLTGAWNKGGPFSLITLSLLSLFMETLESVSNDEICHAQSTPGRSSQIY